MEDSTVPPTVAHPLPLFLLSLLDFAVHPRILLLLLVNLVLKILHILTHVPELLFGVLHGLACLFRLMDRLAKLLGHELFLLLDAGLHFPE